ncbi:hypothetical protein GCM10010215_66920 [Streptomyces virginiae]|uniref:Uncharacterized protein n=1 Tax=Streptomyces virginiae TaxID=1961 RepID=A0ABQ3NN01_STRVG|nr:hypothetical protein GCM10010215_66920 [Streptomyces virginiae]GHI14146.1 hypothetical protein Scinn_36090 [Streptomyces virginiae]
MPYRPGVGGTELGAGGEGEGLHLAPEGGDGLAVPGAAGVVHVRVAGGPPSTGLVVADVHPGILGAVTVVPHLGHHPVDDGEVQDVAALAADDLQQDVVPVVHRVCGGRAAWTGCGAAVSTVPVAARTAVTARTRRMRPARRPEVRVLLDVGQLPAIAHSWISTEEVAA